MNQNGNQDFTVESVAKHLYQQLLSGWNNRNAEEMTEHFAQDGEMIGFDGSHFTGREAAVANLKPIFAHHPTAPFVAKVKSVRSLGENAVVLRAIAGMVPVGQSKINPNVNTHHTLIAANNNDKWEIVLFQNTPAQFHGRPDLVEEMTEELQELVK